MRSLSLVSIVAVMSVVWLAGPAGEASAIDLGALDVFNVTGLLGISTVDVGTKEACDRCGKAHGGEQCIERIPVEKCVKGKKKVYNSKIRCEFVAVPETRYRWVHRWVTKEIPTCYDKPVCLSKDGQRCHQTEQWVKDGVGTCSKCGGIYCKHCENKPEDAPCKYCGRKPGQTVIKVHYKSCVKEAYTVYRQVRNPVCIKQPRYEHVKVPITTYVCRHAKDDPCDGGDDCRQGDGSGYGCDQ